MKNVSFKYESGIELCKTFGQFLILYDKLILQTGWSFVYRTLNLKCLLENLNSTAAMSV